MGNIEFLMLASDGVVFFTLLLVTGNTMAIAVRERIGELAVLKAVGYSDRFVLGLVLAESLLIATIGGGIGLLLARGTGVPWRRPDPRHAASCTCRLRARRGGRDRARGWGILAGNAARGLGHAAEGRGRAAEDVTMAIPITYNLRSLRVRWTSTVVAVLGIAGTVGVFVAMLALAGDSRPRWSLPARPRTRSCSAAAPTPR